MTDVTTKAPDITTIKSAGQPERVDFTNQKQPEQQTQTQDPPAADPPAAAPAATTSTQDPPAATEVKLPDVNDDQLKQLLESKGIKGFENLDELKGKIEKANAPVVTELTAEEKKAAEAALDKRMLDQFIADGGTAEAYVAVKQIASMDLRELSIAEIKKELKEKNWTDSEIDAVIKERYYQLNPDELEKNKTWDEDKGEWIVESDEDFNKRKEFLKKKVAAFTPKLETRSTHTKKNAETILNNLREAVKAEDSKKQLENQILSKVDEISKNFPREISFELGEVNKTKQSPVVYAVTEADIAEVAAEFKDSATRQKILLNEDKTLNLTNLMELKLRNRILESALKAAYIEGGNRQVAAFEKVFPGSAKALGVGGSQEVNNKGRKGHIVSAGAPEVAVPQHT